MTTRFAVRGTYQVSTSEKPRQIDETFATRREAQFRIEDLLILDFRGLSALKIVEVQS